MGGFGSFYKGEKKKKKKGQEGGNINYAPVFVLPEIIGRVKKKEK